MKVIETRLKDACLIEPSVFGDNRGWFMESYSFEKLSLQGLNTVFVQDNHSYSKDKGVLRGLHFQTSPKSQSKLVRCVRGCILDVIVDLREGSPTYLQHFMVELSEENKLQLFVPKGFAHGFVTLMNDCEVIYKVDELYSKEHDRSVRYNDPIFNIDWPNMDFILSEKDSNAPYYKDCDNRFYYQEEQR